MSVKSKTGSRRKSLMIISLVLVVVLVSSLIAYRFLVIDNGFVRDGSVRVKTATELRDVVNNAEVHVPVTIALSNDISLGPALVIPAGADITLKSASEAGFFRLIGLDGVNVITVENGGRLTLSGIIVTHDDTDGIGVVVETGGALIMTDGEVSGNGAEYGGGVSIRGGTFELVGGMISGNKLGGGVSGWGSFIVSGGNIVGNTASRGGGVFFDGDFEMSGGTISGNQAFEYGGGVYVNWRQTFTMSGGEIYGNTAAISGGGVCVWTGSFNMSGGEISNNHATEGYGGGVYNYYGILNRSGGTISGNTAAVGNDIHEKLGNSTSPI